MRTITLDEFKKLVPMDDHQKRVEDKQVYGKFGISARVQEAQCEDLKVGKTVFYFESAPDLNDPDVGVEILLVQANVV